MTRPPDDEGARDVDASDYLTVVRRFWRSILMLTVAGGLAGLVGAWVQTPVYESSAEVLFVGDDGPTVQLAVLTYVDLARTDAVLEPVSRALEAGDPEDIAERLSVGSSPGSQLITITITDTHAARAQAQANAVAESLVHRAAEAETEVSDTPINRGSVVEGAETPGDPTGPDKRRYAVGGALAGLLLGTAQALARYLRNRQDNA